jgi:hypothetical protein
MPVGLWLDGVRHHEAEIVPLCGADEEQLGDPTRWASPAARASALIAATVARIGSLVPASLDDVRELCVLDRDALLIALRQAVFGDHIQATLTCPRYECGRPVDLDFNLSDLPLPARDGESPFFSLTIGGRTLLCRLPNGGDQEAVAELAGTDPQRAECSLLERCAGLPEPPLTHDEASALREELSRRDPQLENELDAACPECGHAFTVYFDIQDYLLQELAQGRGRLYEQVHTLAWYYHWSEAEILALPSQRRRTYLRLLADVLAEADGATV